LINKREFSGIIILFIGVALLTFTFLNAYWFLTQNLGLVATGDLINAFGEALAPLIATCIRVMYLGIMGWIGSLLTLRGIPLLTQKEKKLTVSNEAKRHIQIPQKRAAPIKQAVKGVSQVKEEKTERVEETERPRFTPEATSEKQQPVQEKPVEKPEQSKPSQEPKKLEETKEEEKKEEKEEATEEMITYPATVNKKTSLSKR